MSNSFKATNEQIESIIHYYNADKINIKNDIFLFQAKAIDFSVSIYKNGTVFFQGKEAEKEFLKWNPNDLDLKNKTEKKMEMNHIGSDEVGCGDYFGPVVVCAALVKKEDYPYLYEIGIQDSKQLTDIKIQNLALLLQKRVQYVSFVLSTKKYNELHEKGYNLNKIKAYLHNFVLYKLAEKTQFKGEMIVDQFCSEKLYYHYLNDFHPNEIQYHLHFTPKAENKYLAVACASILARDLFIKEMQKLENEIGYSPIYYGAGHKVDELATKIVIEKGTQYLKKYVKFHYKNTEKVLQNLNEKKYF